MTTVETGARKIEAQGSEPKGGGVCYADSVDHKSNDSYRAAEAAKSASADKHLPNCAFAESAASYPNPDDPNLDKQGYKKTISSGQTYITKGNDTWVYQDGKPWYHDHTENGRIVRHTTDGDQITWDHGGLQRLHKDGSYSDQSNDGKSGFYRDKDGNENHWGPKDEDNWQKDKNGTITHINQKTHTREITYANGDKKFESLDGSSGYTHEDLQKQGPYVPALPRYREKHWGKNSDDNYELTRYFDATVRKYNDRREVEFDSGQKVVRRGNHTSSTGRDPDMNYERDEDPNTHAVHLKYKDGREYVSDSSGYYYIQNGKRVPIGSLPQHEEG